MASRYIECLCMYANSFVIKFHLMFAQKFRLRVIVDKPPVIDNLFEEPELCTIDTDRSGSLSIFTSSYSLTVLIFCIIAATM